MMKRQHPRVTIPASPQPKSRHKSRPESYQVAYQHHLPKKSFLSLHHRLRVPFKTSQTCVYRTITGHVEIDLQATTGIEVLRGRFRRPRIQPSPANRQKKEENDLQKYEPVYGPARSSVRAPIRRLSGAPAAQSSDKFWQVRPQGIWPAPTQGHHEVEHYPSFCRARPGDPRHVSFLR